MSERGLPPEGAPACPFVAFEDDRDGRATAPDHRHRCFAEPRPATRALAHQEAYCLASAFPVCPTFQDWARREAAAARPSAPSQAAVRDEPPQSRPLPPLEREPRRTASDAAAAADPSGRLPHRDWAAPPPWTGEDVAAAGLAGAAGLAAGAAGAAAAGALDDDAVDDDRYAPPRDDERYAPPRDATPGPAPQPALAPATPVLDADYPVEARGLAGSAAHRLAGPDPDEPIPARPTGAHADDDLDDWAVGAARAAVAGSAAGSRGVPPPRRYEPAPRRDDRARDRGTPGRGEPTPGRGEPTPRKPVGQDPNELFGPAWERPRRYEAYPSLRTRMGIPALGGLPKVAIWALILLLAALVIFLFGPSLLGIGGKGDNGAAGGTPTPAASEEATEAPSPTEPPAPTPQVYVVAKGDTMSKIAKKFGVTVEQIMAANPKIKNPDRIKVGDQITIPVPVQDDSAATDGAGSQAP